MNCQIVTKIRVTTFGVVACTPDGAFPTPIDVTFDSNTNTVCNCHWHNQRSEKKQRQKVFAVVRVSCRHQKYCVLIKWWIKKRRYSCKMRRPMSFRRWNSHRIPVNFCWSLHGIAPFVCTTPSTMRRDKNSRMMHPCSIAPFRWVMNADDFVSELWIS